MQDNDIRITVKTLLRLGKFDAIKEIGETLKQDYDFICEILEGKHDSTQPTALLQEKPISASKILLYSKNWPNAEKFIFILKNCGKFIKFRDAAKEIIKIEGEGDEDYLTRRLTASTRDLKLDGKIVKVSIGGHANTFWGLSKWLNDDGSIKTGYEYEKDSITTKSEANTKSSSGLLDDL